MTTTQGNDSKNSNSNSNNGKIEQNTTKATTTTATINNKNEDSITPGLAIKDSFHDEPNYYQPTWRPPTPPRQAESDSENKSWFQSLLPGSLNSGNNSESSSFRRSPNKSKNRRKYPPEDAFHINVPNISSALSDDSAVDRSLLLQDESLITDSTAHLAAAVGSTSIHAVKSNAVPSSSRSKLSIKDAIVGKFLKTNDNTNADHNNKSHAHGSANANPNNNDNDTMANGSNMNNDSDSIHYQMMNDQNDNSLSLPIISSKRRTNRKSKSKSKFTNHDTIREKCDFFYNGIEEIEAQNQTKSKSAWSMKQTPASFNYKNEQQQNSNEYYTSSEYFHNPNSRSSFMKEYSKLNSTLMSKDGDDIEDHDAEDHFNDDYGAEDEEEDDHGLDFKTLFTFGCSPTSRDKELHRRGLTADDGDLPAISDIRKSSLSYINNGRMQIRLPGDRVRLLMDENMEAGVFSVEKDIVLPARKQGQNDNNNHYDDLEIVRGESYYNDDDNQERVDIRSPLMANDKQHFFPSPLQSANSNKLSSRGNQSENQSRNNTASSKLPELNYVLTIDQDIYKRVLSEVTDSRAPCGFYYCCHDYDSKSVNIKVAIGILFIVFSFILWGTCVWPT